MSKRSTSYDDGSPTKRKRYDNTPVPQLYYVFHGEVASVKEYGIFVKIPDTRRQGLVHKSQISKARVDDPSEMFSTGEMVYCKVISLDENGEKIGLGMKMVNQTTGDDLDPNNVELSQDENRRRQGGGRGGRQKIQLDAVYNTTCKKCGGQGHLAQDCFKTGDGNYELIPDLDDYMKTVDHQSTSAKKKQKKAKKEKKKKQKDKKQRRHSTSDSDSSDTQSQYRKKKKSHKSRHRTDSDSESDTGHSKHKHKKKHHKRSHSSSSSNG